MRYKKFFSLLFVPLILIAFQQCAKQQQAEEINEHKILNQDTVAVKISKAEYRDIEISKTFSSTLEGEEQANVVAKVSERIVRINAKVGDFVPKGKVVVELDKVGAASQFYQAEAGYLNAKKDLERMEALYAEGAISQQMLDGTKTAFNIAKANYDAAKSLVELTAPISGAVTEINSETGDLTAPGIQIIKIANINRLKAIFNIGEQDITSVGVGQQIEVYSELQPELIMKGSISQISKSADVQSRTFEIKGLFNNTNDRWFKPGMFCRVKLVLKNKKSSLTIPSAALVINGNEKGVYVINDGKAYYKSVSIGIFNNDFTEITRGLNEHAKVVVLGMNNLKDGIPVHISE